MPYDLRASVLIHFTMQELPRTIRSYRTDSKRSAARL